MRLRLVTYNIHKGIGGVDRRYRPERTIELLARYDADLIFLQEVDDGVPRSQRHRQVDLLGDALEMPYRAFQRNVSLKQGHYGNAILSRHLLHDVHDIDLSVPLKKPRRALVARCLVRKEHQRSLQLVNCHLGLAGFERVIQLGRILESSTLSRIHRSTPAIVGGDYNDVWGTLGKRVMEPAGYFPAGTAAPTFPAIMPVRALDRIYYRGDIRFDNSFAARSVIARHASDHLPLIADFDLDL
ncbi:MAG: endonuclease/exonuclease/phosphatase family metal-dependent hydrolase [Gammaproteobacteria bacterium]|jgi:endonuclease/exonuclease/phosphatase family metal-dependent hydrolase